MRLEQAAKSPHAFAVRGGTIMTSLKFAAGLFAASALVSFAYGADDQKTAPGMAMPSGAASDMGGMNMKMTLPPIAALYPEAQKPGAPVLAG
jgi:hypothetical protein